MSTDIRFEAKWVQNFVDVFRRARIAFHDDGEFPALFPAQPPTPNIAQALS